MTRATIIGHAIIDVVAGPVGEELFETGSIPMQDIKMTYGGNGYNEASALSALGVDVNLISKLGNDEAGMKVLDKLVSLGVDTRSVILEDGLTTSINVVLFDEKGERRFLTNPSGSQRKLSKQDVLPALVNMADIVCFSCMFVSPLYDISSMKVTFAEIKKKGKTLVVDMTKPKNGETIDNLKELLPYIDYFLPNEEELKLLCCEEIDQAAQMLLAGGVKCVVVKVGGKGCRVYKQNEIYVVPAYKVEKAVDTTGAGDSFVAGFIYGLVNDMTLLDCARFGNATASCSVEHIGATDGIVSIDEPMKRYEGLAILNNKMLKNESI